MTRQAAFNRAEDLERYREHVAEEIAILRDALAVEEARYARLCATDVEFDPDPSTRERPGIDLSMFQSAGTDVAETFRPREDIIPRSCADVPVGDRL